MSQPPAPRATVTFAGSGDAVGSGGRFQACIHLRVPGQAPVLLDCGATSLSALKACYLDPGEISTVFVSPHLHGDHFGGLPFLVLDGQFSHRTTPLTVAGPPAPPTASGRRWKQRFPALPPSAAASPSTSPSWHPAARRP
jgi:ribonuclease BN (tRNA processing enzyme)